MNDIAPADKKPIGELIPAGTPAEAVSTPALEVTLTQLLAALDDYRELLATSVPFTIKKRIKELKRIVDRMSKFQGEVGEQHTKYIAKGPHAAQDMLDAMREFDRLSKSRVVDAMARSVFIGTFSAYDAFIGNLLKVIYSKQPALLKSIKREVSLTDLLDFTDLAAVKRDMLDREIDSFRRCSYVEQFEQLESKFQFQTLRDFPEWAQFVEMSQRRNVVTHNDGCVSPQYLLVCDRAGFQFKNRPIVGSNLELTPRYLTQTMFIIAKVAFMLVHTLWRKLFPDEAEVANESLNNVVYGLLQEKRWVHAASFGTFGLQKMMCKGVPELYRRMRVVNTSIALKHCGKNDEAIKLLDAEDWSASTRDFKLANAVLRNNIAEATQLMRDIGKRGELIQQLAYHVWPLFHGFRNTAEFQATYETIYGIAFNQKVAQDVQNTAEDIEKIARRELHSKLQEVEDHIESPVKRTHRAKVSKDMKRTRKTTKLADTTTRRKPPRRNARKV